MCALLISLFLIEMFCFKITWEKKTLCNNLLTWLLLQTLLSEIKMSEENLNIQSRVSVLNCRLFFVFLDHMPDQVFYLIRSLKFYCLHEYFGEMPLVFCNMFIPILYLPLMLQIQRHNQNPLLKVKIWIAAMAYGGRSWNLKSVSEQIDRKLTGAANIS